MDQHPGVEYERSFSGQCQKRITHGMSTCCPTLGAADRLGRSRPDAIEYRIGPSVVGWQRQDRAEALRALRDVPRDRLTERESDYLATLDVLFGEGDKESRDDLYAEAVGALAARYSGDLDAAAFHALALLGTAHEGRDFATYMRAAAIAEEVFDQNPRHPGAAHYLIHAYDDPVHAPLGLRPARIYAEIAPDASHALHMPSHIYVALGMWDEAAEMNRRSFEAARAATQRRGEGLNGHGWHALYWLGYIETQRGRFAEARRLLEQAERIAAAEPSRRGTLTVHAMRAGYLVETEDVSVLPDDLRLGAELGDGTKARALYAAGLAGVLAGDAEAARARLQQLDALAAESDSPAVEATAVSLEGMIHLSAGDVDEGIAVLEEAVAIEDAMPLDFGPPFPVKPAHELLGDALLDLGRHAEAATHYEAALARAPRRAPSLYGLARAAEAAGHAVRAAEAWTDLRAVWHDADASVRALLGPRPSVGQRGR